MPTMKELMRVLAKNNVSFEVLDHKPTISAHQIAVVTHNRDSDVAKVVIIEADGKFWMTVSRADQRVSERLLRARLGAKTVRLAREEDFAQLFPGCDLGAMPPFGNLYGLPVLVDEEIACNENILFSACERTRALRIRYQDYKRIVHPMVADFAELPNLEEHAE